MSLGRAGAALGLLLMTLGRVPATAEVDVPLLYVQAPLTAASGAQIVLRLPGGERRGC